MNHILPGDTRQPLAGSVVYPSRIDTPDPAVPMGPNRLGELLWPVTIERLDDGRTRVGFSYVAPVVVAP